ncbi:uncharacterized protein EV420DRAFT_1474843 [Desarmillaria tabescens]|uniref:Uncharacterized protein n=1 Tax=Armillaria tabescens TaxID=1929756 RepID=A0AA39NI20_ARMTA|nr:uncharacterized protein EV420DRAFT_1474843 [Desarmillaria tabescens]KAK0466030.1 hypothetical protein EV420DRAFT_1474843 [Desarmillaria tabescens]
MTGISVRGWRLLLVGVVAGCIMLAGWLSTNMGLQVDGGKEVIGGRYHVYQQDLGLWKRYIVSEKNTFLTSQKVCSLVDAGGSMKLHILSAFRDHCLRKRGSGSEIRHMAVEEVSTLEFPRQQYEELLPVTASQFTLKFRTTSILYFLTLVTRLDVVVGEHAVMSMMRAHMRSTFSSTSPLHHPQQIKYAAYPRLSHRLGVKELAWEIMVHILPPSLLILLNQTLIGFYCENTAKLTTKLNVSMRGRACRFRYTKFKDSECIPLPTTVPPSRRCMQNMQSSRWLEQENWLYQMRHKQLWGESAGRQKDSRHSTLLYLSSV